MKKVFTLSLFFLATFAMNAQTILLQENFEGTGLPSGWSQTTSATDGGWKFGTSAQMSSSSWSVPNNGSKIAASNDDACNCNKANDYLIMPPFDFSNHAAVALSFDMYYRRLSYQGATESAWIRASIDGGATWEAVGDEIPAGPNAWRTGYTVNLSAYAGKDNVLIAFHYNDGSGWTFGWAIDNVTVFSPAANDIRITKLNNPRFKQFGTELTIEGEIVNMGAENLTSFTVAWSDGIDTHKEDVTGIDIPYLGSYSFSHGTTMSLSQAVTYNFDVWVDDPNGNDDANFDDNQLPGIVSGVTYIPNKKMFAEEGTGTWCQWCPRGTDWMEYMTINYPDQFIGVAVHNQDPMTLAEYNSGAAFSAFPNAMVDRVILNIDPSQLENQMPSAMARIAPVAPDVTATLDVATMTLTANSSVEFVTQMDGLNYRLGIILTEDHVTGTGSGYNQVNAYANQVDPLPGYGFDWHLLPNPAPASIMYYDHVGRALLGGFAGQAGSVPSSVVAGDVASHTFTMNNFNKNWDPYNMHAVVIVRNHANGEVLNAEKSDITVICPADFGVNIEVTGDTIGSGGTGSATATLSNPNFGFGSYTFAWSNGATTATASGLAAGNYTVVVSDKIGCSQTIDVTVSPITSTREIESLTSLTLTPNPASSISLLDARFDRAVDAQVAIVNAVGQVMEMRQFSGVANIRHEFNLNQYPDGIYLVKVAVGNQLRTERLIIAR